MPPRFHVPAASTDHGAVTFGGDEAHHLRHVMRLGPGAAIQVFDGAGREWSATVTTVGRDEVTIDLGAAVTPAREPRVRVSLCVGLLKGDQMDAVVRDATALGVSAITPVLSAHVAVPKAAWRNAAAIERWQRVAVAAAKQCGRAVVPKLSAALPFEDALRVEAIEASDALVMCLEPARASAGIAVASSAPAAARLLVGPEGGWSQAEVDRARELGARDLSLGPRTLRAETTPVVALAALWTMWGW